MDVSFRREYTVFLFFPVGLSLGGKNLQQELVRGLVPFKSPAIPFNKNTQNTQTGSKVCSLSRRNAFFSCTILFFFFFILDREIHYVRWTGGFWFIPL